MQHVLHACHAHLQVPGLLSVEECQAVIDYAESLGITQQGSRWVCCPRTVPFATVCMRIQLCVVPLIMSMAVLLSATGDKLTSFTCALLAAWHTGRRLALPLLLVQGPCLWRGLPEQWACFCSG